MSSNISADQIIGQSNVIGDVKAALRKTIPLIEKELKDTHEITVYKEVYDRYTPKSGYVRRYTMSDQKNFKITSKESKQGFDIELENMATGRKSRRLDDIITYASGHRWRGIPKRPFIARTQTAFNKEVVGIIKKSLIAQGIEVK